MNLKIFLGIILGTYKLATCQIDSEKIVIPNLSAMSDKALKVILLADNFGNYPINRNSIDISAQAKLYWNNNSIFVEMTILDDSITNSDNAELFVSDAKGGKNMMQFIFSDFNKKTAKCTLWDLRGTRTLAEMPVKYNYSSVTSMNKTAINIELPIYQLGITKCMDAELGINLMVGDIDAKNSSHKNSLKWSNIDGTDRNSLATVAVKLGKEKSAEINSSLKVFWDNDSLVIIRGFNINKGTLSVKDFYSQKEITLTNISTNKLGNYVQYYLHNIFRSNQILSKISIYQNGNKLEDIDLAFAPKNDENIKNVEYEDEFNLFGLKDLNKKNNPNILFVGHSMFRYWFTMENDFEGYKILNRGFGGSRLENIIANYDKVIHNYQPKTIVLINGCNDMAYGDSPELAFSEFKTLVDKIHTDMPSTKLIILTHTEFYYGYFKNLKAYDDLMINYILQSNWIQLADIRKALPENIHDLHACLLPDITHLNAKGYKLLTPIILNQLQK